MYLLHATVSFMFLLRHQPDSIARSHIGLEKRKKKRPGSDAPVVVSRDTIILSFSLLMTTRERFVTFHYLHFHFRLSS